MQIPLLVVVGRVSFDVYTDNSVICVQLVSYEFYFGFVEFVVGDVEVL
jgi:hypothetical protein